MQRNAATAPPTDAALVRAMLAGDESAFRHFFATYFPRIYRFALPRLAGDIEATKEVVQASLTKAVRSLAQSRRARPVILTGAEERATGWPR